MGIQSVTKKFRLEYTEGRSEERKPILF